MNTTFHQSPIPYSRDCKGSEHLATNSHSQRCAVSLQDLVSSSNTIATVFGDVF